MLSYSRQNMYEDSEKSLDFARQAEIIACKYVAVFLIADALKTQGDAFSALNDEKNAASYYQQGLELTSATLLIASKNEAFENLRKMAEQIKAGESENGFEKAREIIREINRQTDVESQWEQFRLHFESIHKSFFVKLREASSSLTQPDLQLCAYIKLNMGTREIARLMNITPESVNTHRYRLRKKLDLTSLETLDDFVHAIKF